MKSKTRHIISKDTSVIVFDVGDKAIDRYTVVIYGEPFEYTDANGLVNHQALALSEGGVSVSMWIEVTINPGLGKRVPWESLSEETRNHIVRRVLE